MNDKQQEEQLIQEINEERCYMLEIYTHEEGFRYYLLQDIEREFSDLDFKLFSEFMKGQTLFLVDNDVNKTGIFERDYNRFFRNKK
jgi:hypothetical protein